MQIRKMLSFAPSSARTAGIVRGEFSKEFVPTVGVNLFLARAVHEPNWQNIQHRPGE